MAKIAELLGQEVVDDVDEMADKAISAVEQLKRDIGIPQCIRDIGGTQEQLPTFAEKAFTLKRLMWVNPRKATQADLLGILESAY